MTMNSINPKNVKAKDIVKVKASEVVVAASVSRTTKTMIVVSLEGDEFRFRRSDGKEVASNGKLVEDGASLKLNDIIRFAL